MQDKDRPVSVTLPFHQWIVITSAALITHDDMIEGNPDRTALAEAIPAVLMQIGGDSKLAQDVFEFSAKLSVVGR